MTAVLGIDAAWTANNNSGIVVVGDIERGWRLAAAAPSLLRFARNDESRKSTSEKRR